MSLRRYISILITMVLLAATAQPVEAQFWKKKNKARRHASKKTKEAAARRDGAVEEDVNEEDSRTDEQPAATPETRKEKKERKKREKREQKEKEKLKKEKEKKEKKERDAKAKAEKSKKDKKETGETKKSKKSKKKKKGAADEATTTGTMPVMRKWADIEYPKSQKKERYRIDILAPIYLDELVKGGYVVKNIPEKAAPGLNFYKGVQIAADTLKRAGFNIDIYVHDVASLLESTDMLISKNMLDSTDLIIGAVSTKDVASLAAYAKRRKINFVSLNAPTDGVVKDNQYLTLLQPSLQSHCEWIASDVTGNATGGARKKAVLLYRTTVPADNTAYGYLMADPNQAAGFNTVMCNTIPGREELRKQIDTAAENTVVIAVQDVNYADSLLKTLKRYYPRTRFDVYGMPTWSAMANIHKPGAYAGMAVNVTTASNFDGSGAAAKYVERVFKKEYGGRPQEMVYKGYESLFWYVNLLKRYGNMFNKQYSDNETAPFTKFEIKPQWDNTGNIMYLENRHLFLHKYENGTYTTHE